MAKEKANFRKFARIGINQNSNTKTNPINPVKFGIACSIAWALLIVSTAFGAMFVQTENGPWGTEFVRVFGSLYVGFGPSFQGAFIGMLWGLFDGFLAGFIIASIYNYLNRS